MFIQSGFKRTLCGSKWETYESSWVTSTARYGCCLANRYMSSPEGTGTFNEVNSCSACPAGTHVSSLTSDPNDETSCDCVVGSFDDPTNTGCQLCASGKCSAAGSVTCATCSKMPDGCLGKNQGDRDCDLRIAVDELIALNADGSGTHPTYGPVAEWDMSLVTDLRHAFRSKGSFNGDISKWQTQKVTTLAYSK